jgi:hypothetical protein
VQHEERGHLVLRGVRAPDRLDRSAVRRSPLRLVISGNEIVVDVQMLGEYPTTVSRIRFSDLSQSKIVWEVKAERGIPQVHEFSLRPDDSSPALEPQ